MSEQLDGSTLHDRLVSISRYPLSDGSGVTLQLGLAKGISVDLSIDREGMHYLASVLLHLGHLATEVSGPSALQTSVSVRPVPASSLAFLPGDNGEEPALVLGIGPAQIAVTLPPSGLASLRDAVTR